MPNQPLKPGQETPFSGIYAEVGPRGGERCRRVTAVEGKPLPPTEQAGNSYKLVEKTKDDKCK